MVAMAIQNQVKEISALTNCYTKLENLHKEVCEKHPSEDSAWNKVCLGWKLDSRSLPSGCYFRIKKV